MKAITEASKLIALAATCATVIPVHAGDPTAIDTHKVTTISTGPALEGYTLSLRTGKRSYFPGEAITLLVSLKNVSNEEVVLFQKSSLDQYETSVALPAQQQAPVTLYGKRMLIDSKFRGSGGPTLKLKSGEEFAVPIPVSRLYDMSLAGTYSLSISVRVPNRDHSGGVKLTSNVVHVTVAD